MIFLVYSDRQNQLKTEMSSDHPLPPSISSNSPKKEADMENSGTNKKQLLGNSGEFSDRSYSSGTEDPSYGPDSSAKLLLYSTYSDFAIENNENGRDSQRGNGDFTRSYSSPECIGFAEVMHDGDDGGDKNDKNIGDISSTNILSNFSTSATTTAGHINRRLKKADVMLTNFMDRIPLRKNTTASNNSTTNSNNSCDNNHTNNYSTYDNNNTNNITNNTSTTYDTTSDLPELQLLQCDGSEGVVAEAIVAESAFAAT